MTADGISFLDTATEIVLRAGEMQMAQFGKNLEISKKADIDLVTDVDLAVERMCQEVLRLRHPSHRLVGEEYGAADISSLPGFCWVFDPIDGTTNYAHGVPIFCSSLALQIDGVMNAGAVYDPTRRELFTAERGRGAHLNGAAIAVSRSATLIDSLLVTGFPYDVHRRLDEPIALFAEFLSRARAVRRLGSAAIDLCYVAAGRMDGFWEQKLKPWDTAAGALIVQEAGGRVTDFDGSPFDPDSGRILATNGVIHEAMVDTIQALHRSRNWT